MLAKETCVAKWRIASLHRRFGQRTPALPRPVRFLPVLALVAAFWCSGAAASGGPCQAAAEAAEAAERLPAGLLLAIGRVESGLYDRETRRVEPWPWSTDEAGTDHVFASADAAVGWTRAALADGRRLIDVGCFQINLFHHPDAFASLEEAFAPAANARYAARFLRTLFERSGSWAAAVEQYHSGTPALGTPYRARVFALWGMPADAPEETAPARPARLALFAGPIAAGVRVVTPGAPAAVSISVATWLRTPRRGLPRIVTLD